MKIGKIMKLWIGDSTVDDGINEMEDVYSLDLEKIRKMKPVINITDGNGKKKGEVKRETLERILGTPFNQMFSAILDQMDDGIIAIDSKGMIFYVNEKYSEILSVPIGKILGRYMQDVEGNAAILDVLVKPEPIVLESRYIKNVDKYVSCRINPITIRGELRGVVSFFKDATEIETLSQKIKRANQVARNLQQQVKTQEDVSSLGIIGEGPLFKHMIEKAAIVAETDVPVLIRGENGSGKELVAKFIHQRSSRADKPFITVNCAAIPENLIESELFGYEGGSFTGAKTGGKMGKFEMADGGTLFLDEIGDMPLNMQTKLLRAIQENEIEKIGRERNVSVDVRIISATNQPLEKMMENKAFRNDLYYRINTVSIQVPPLRDRKHDIAILVDHFLRHFNTKYGKSVYFAEDVISFFYRYQWPGNVRELKNFIERSVIMCQNGVVKNINLEGYMDSGNDKELSTHETKVPGKENQYVEKTLKEHIKRAEKSFIEETLAACLNNKTAAMQSLGLSRRTFYRKLNEHGLLGGNTKNNATST